MRAKRLTPMSSVSRLCLCFMLITCRPICGCRRCCSACSSVNCKNSGWTSFLPWDLHRVRDYYLTLTFKVTGTTRRHWEGRPSSWSKFIANWPSVAWQGAPSVSLFYNFRCFKCCCLKGSQWTWDSKIRELITYFTVRSPLHCRAASPNYVDVHSQSGDS